MTFVPFSTSVDGLLINGGTTGITITDDSNAGLGIVENGTGPLVLVNEQGPILILAGNSQWTFGTDGSTQFPANGEMGPVTLFTASEDPNGHFTGIQTGDLCVTTEPALYQWSADATPTWVPVAGGAGFSGSFTGTSGIQFTDTSDNGLTLTEQGGGGLSITDQTEFILLNEQSSDGSITLEVNGFSSVFHPDGSLTLPGDIKAAGVPIRIWGTDSNEVGIIAFGTGGIEIADLGGGGIDIQASGAGIVLGTSNVGLDALEAISFNSSTMGFFGEDAVARPTVTGSRTDGTALASLLTALASFGLLVDSSTS